MAVAPGGNGAEVVRASVRVDVRQAERPVDPFFLGMGLHPGERSHLQKPGSVESIREVLGLKSIRFPNGCEADRYDWIRAAEKGFVTVDEFLDFCDQTGCRPYYTVNLQGGTDGLEGPIPPDVSLEEKIRYRHTAPNPCGYPPAKYHYGTLAETVQLVEQYTVQRLLDGRTPILDYELGNENWGQATTDWPPDVYVKTVEVFARAMREVLQRAQSAHPALRSVKLRLVAVGYPVMGNNQDPKQAANHDFNVAWTGGLNRLHAQGLLDAVQEHFYPYSAGTGDALIWSEHNLANIILARRGIPNPRLNGYADPGLAYTMPMDFTEWNLKCWGPVPRFLKMANGDFEDDLAGWSTTAAPAYAARLEVTSAAARRGMRGLQVTTGSKGAWAEARQTIATGGQTELSVLVWIRTGSPARVSLALRNDGHTIQERTATATNRWQRYSVGGKLTNNAAGAEIVLRVRGPKVSASFDNVEVLYYPAGASRAPVSVNTYEQRLFCVDALRQMLQHGAQRTFFHHIFGSYGCGAIAADGNLKDNARAFNLFTGRIGSVVLPTRTTVNTFDYDGHSDPWVTDFNALAPDTQRVPYLSSLAMRDGDRVHLLLLNRATDRTVKAKIRLNAAPVSAAEIRTLTGEDFNAFGAAVTNSTARIGKTFTRAVPPHTAEFVSFKVSER